MTYLFWLAAFVLIVGFAEQPAQTPGRRVAPDIFFHDKLGKIVLLNGTVSQFKQDESTIVWCLDGNSWTPFQDSLAPAVRYAAAAVYNSMNESVVVFSGRSGIPESIVNDTWIWQDRTWHKINDTLMEARDHHSMAYDSKRDEVILFGGGIFPRRPGKWSSETWRLENGRWQKIAYNGPLGRVAPMVFDSKRNCIVLFGGVGEPIAGVQPKFSDTWIWDGERWTNLKTQGPPARSRHAMAFDSKQGKVLLYGGENDHGSLDDFWEWNGKSWSQIKTAGPTPGDRYVHGMAYDPVKNRTILYGGMHSKRLMQDLWEWNGKEWKQLN